MRSLGYYIIQPYIPSCLTVFLSCSRQLLASSVRVVLRPKSRLLHHPDIHTVVSDRCIVVGLLLAEPRRRASPRRPRHHDRPHDDHSHIEHQCVAAQDLLPQEYRCVLGDVLLHGVRVATRVRVRQFHFARLCAGMSRRLHSSESNNRLQDVSAHLSLFCEIDACPPPPCLLLPSYQTYS